MFVVGNFLAAVAQVLDYVLWAYIWILFARVIASWLNADPYNPIVNFLYNATEPVLERIRGILPMYAGGYDLSPLIAWLAIMFVRWFLVRTLFDVAYSMRSGVP
ncbi:MAG TPA: YggT family protein [Candidatus Binatia bacterium]|jgi:YggT family protein